MNKTENNETENWDVEIRVRFQIETQAEEIVAAAAAHNFVENAVELHAPEWLKLMAAQDMRVKKCEVKGLSVLEENK